MNGPNTDAIRRLVVEAAEKCEGQRAEPLTTPERRLLNTLLAQTTQPEEVVM